MSGSVSYHSGLAAERIVEQHYARSGRPICARRWRGRGGEIDLIAQDGDALVFIEVKSARDFDRAAERVTDRQRLRILSAASEYLGQTPMGELTELRFDLALVNAEGQLKVMENAFGP